MSQPNTEEPIRVGEDRDIHSARNVWWAKHILDDIDRFITMMRKDDCTDGDVASYRGQIEKRIREYLEDADADVSRMSQNLATSAYTIDQLANKNKELERAITWRDEQISAAQQEIARLKSELDIMRQHRDDARFKLQRFRDECAADCL